MKRPVDPVTPIVTFDNYVIPQSVQRKTKKQPVLPVSGMMAAVGVIGMLAFVLGIMATLKFAGPSTQMANSLPAPSVTGTDTEPGVTRQDSADLTATRPALMQLPAGGQSSQGALDASELTPQPATMPGDTLQMLREVVLAGTYSVTYQAQNGIDRLILTAPDLDLSRNVTEPLLREAIDTGKVEIAAALRTVNGQIDMDTMLFYLVQTALVEDGTAESAQAAQEMSRRAFAASKARTRLVEGQRVYTVKPGDSLASLSLQFYGQPNAFHRILEANRAQLDAPDAIRTGQQLKIPS
ncbi:LysM peptidoglycan-binding domain-containing protein [Sulfitobacter sp. F26204]|uniref:LysM peptidoglycan-binding domain-containing protein n=1 Tax=Sulfitobacter sp. F26204 TaxID=2996014 RepID=UPI00225E5AAD|nr:LysM peptidoglycan-binding domain-containing protein [Sulfitobacter sp. F26204]MCX7557958.1 LysM peptidoglycan-binding domain-containing protein [Sulfitobacter sp. F26204]